MKHPMRDDMQLLERKPYPASVHFAFVGGILLPLAAIPYLLSRRQTSFLRRRLQETEGVVKTLRRELKVNALAMDKMEAKQMHSATEISQLRESFEEARKKSSKCQADAVQGQKALLEYVVDLEKEIDASKLLHENAIRDVGQSLGNIAGFMYEMELDLGLKVKGKDPRGIERLRSLAARLQQLPR